jgi:hypothetical protein
MTLTKLFALSLAGLIVTSVSDARAQCGMGEVDFYTVERANVARADEMLRQGDAQKAAWLLQRTWPRLREAVPVASSLSFIADGVRLMALAAVRTDGDIQPGFGWSSWTPAEKAQNVAWGVRRLRMLAAADPSSTVVRTDLGEALSRAPSTRDEARTILGALEATDGIATPEGYAALAFVRVEAGDEIGAAVASAECERRASNVEVQCTSLGGRVTPIVTATR